MSRNDLHRFIDAFPGGFIKLFDLMGDICADLAAEWTVAGRKNWGKTFKECSELLAQITVKLAKIDEEYNTEFNATDKTAPKTA